MEIRNRVAIAGTVVEKGGLNDLNGEHGILVETNELSFNGLEEYSHVHPVPMSKTESKSLKKGMKVKIAGKFGVMEFVDKDERNNRIGYIVATSVTPNYAGDDINLGELRGAAHRSFQFFPAKGDQQAFGNVIVRLKAGLMIRGVCFQPTCHRFAQECTTGSEVTVLGRVQHRPYLDRRSGKMKKMLEVVGNDDFTKVIESVELINPFDVMDETEVEAI